MILHTEIVGSGEPVIFLHTGLQTGGTDFETQREHFKQTFRVILPDLRGHGNSISDDFTNYFQDSAKDIKKTMDALEVDSAHIVGCSLGALVGLKFAKEYPNRVKSLTISGIVAEKPKNWDELMKKDIEYQSNILKNEETISHLDRLHKSDWKKLLYLTQDKDWYPFDETEDLTMLDLPVLFIVGEGNTYETSGVIIYPKMNKNIHVSIIPFASHLVHLEQPQIYTSVVYEFISRVQS